MERLLRCDCGFEVRADEAHFVAEVQRHALEAHAMRFSQDDVLRLTLRTDAATQHPESPKGGEDEG